MVYIFLIKLIPVFFSYCTNDFFYKIYVHYYSYKNAVHGLWRVATEEGVTRLWAGATMTCSRAVLMTIGQLSFYDKIKELLLATKYLQDNVFTHVTSSLLAVSFMITYNII